MPVKNLICDATHEPREFNECVDCAVKGTAKVLGCGHSPDVLRGIVKMFRPPSDVFSVTELLDCPRAVILKLRNDYSIKPSRAYWMYRGVLAHKMLEAQPQEGDIAEKRMFAEIEGFKVSGQPDLIRGKVIMDWKTTKKVPAVPNQSHIAQLSYYRVLASLQDPKIEITHGQIIYLDMSEHKVMDVDLTPIPIAKALMVERLRLLNESVKYQLTPEYSEYFDLNHWKCGRTPQASYCEVRDICVGANVAQEPSRRIVRIQT